MSKRTWTRIRREFAGGASVPWLSARHGPSERTISTHAKAEGWRRRDLAAQADAALEAEEAALALASGVASDLARLVEATCATGDEEASAGDGAEGRAGVDLSRAMRLAQAQAVACLVRGDARGAQDFLKLAQMLEGADEADEQAGRTGGPTAADEAAMAFIMERLGEVE